MTITQFTQRLIIALAIIGIWAAVISEQPPCMDKLCQDYPTINECPPVFIKEGSAL